MKKKLTVIVLKPMHKLLHLWVCEMEKATLTWPIMKFPDFFFFLCIVTVVVAVTESIAALDAAARNGCVFADQMAH